MDQFLRSASGTGFLEIWLPPCQLPLSLFLPLPPSPFQAEFPSGAWRLTTSTYVPWLLRPTREGAQGGAPSAIQADGGGLTEMVQISCFEFLLDFHVNKIFSLISPLNFPTAILFHNLSYISN